VLVDDLQTLVVILVTDLVMLAHLPERTVRSAAFSLVVLNSLCRLAILLMCWGVVWCLSCDSNEQNDTRLQRSLRGLLDGCFFMWCAVLALNSFWRTPMPLCERAELGGEGV
jgi:hypothetical protein